MGRKDKILKSPSRLGQSCEAVPMLRGWHPDAHRAMGMMAVNIASKPLSSLHYARASLFQRHTALLEAKSVVCLMSGFDFQVKVFRLKIIHSTVAV